MKDYDGDLSKFSVRIICENLTQKIFCLCFNIFYSKIIHFLNFYLTNFNYISSCSSILKNLMIQHKDGELLKTLQDS